jgi:hypothetical protein
MNRDTDSTREADSSLSLFFYLYLEGKPEVLAFSGYFSE